MKTKNVYPPDFGEFYVSNFGKDFAYSNSNILICNFLQTNSFMYLTFCYCYWGEEQFLLVLKFDFLKVPQLLKFGGNREFRNKLSENFYFKNTGIVMSDFEDAPLEEFYDTPIEVMLESIPTNEYVRMWNKPYRIFEVINFSFPKVLNLKKKNKQK